MILTNLHDLDMRIRRSRVGSVIDTGYANPAFQFVIFDVNPSAVRVTGSVNAGSTFACNDVPVILAEPET